MIDEIKELKQLLDDGIITREDFDKQKKKILGMPTKETEFIDNSIKVELKKEESKSLDDYEKELIAETERQEEKEANREKDDYYGKEKLKEKAKLDAKEEAKKEKQDQIKQNINKGATKSVRIFKWILTIFCWLMTFGSILALSQNIILYFLWAIIFALLGAMACPKITDHTQDFSTYTKYKKWIVTVLLILFVMLPQIFQ